MTFAPEDMSVDDLQFDLDNPRVPLVDLENPDAALEYLLDTADVGELVNSIALSGWIDIEPLIVLRQGKVVIEGNRRLAALRLIREPGLAERLGVTIPGPLHPNAKPALVRCLVVDRKNDARDYIGFKHINGPFKWDAFAKAKYAADWIEDGEDVREVARRLGDAHNTVVRLVNGYRVYLQAVQWGFERDKVAGRFSFSHLYTALTRPAYRDFLGLPDSTDLLSKNPVDTDHRDQLIQIMVWLFGQDELRPVIKSQNPDLKRLAEVLPSTVARQTLLDTNSLDEAHDLVEDKKAAFSSALSALNTQARKVSAMIGNYEHDDELLEMARSVTRTVRAIEAAMRSEADHSTGGGLSG